MPHISYLVAAATLVGGLAIAGAASADPMGGRHGGSCGGWHGFGGTIDFKAIDTDGNGSLSRAELMTHATARIATADTNNDGSLDRAELAAALPGPNYALIAVFSETPAERFADRILAVTGNTETGSVTVQALAERRVNMLLAVADTDRDAAISQAEADAMRPWRGHGDSDDGDSDGMGQMPGMMEQMPGMMEQMRGMRHGATGEPTAPADGMEQMRGMQHGTTDAPAGPPDAPDAATNG